MAILRPCKICGCVAEKFSATQGQWVCLSCEEPHAERSTTLRPTTPVEDAPPAACQGL